jgi:hypothetical protein
VSFSYLLTLGRREVFRSIILFAVGIALGSWTCLEANAAGAPTCVLDSQLAADFSGDPVTDVHAISNYKKAVSALFQAQKFQELDCLADAARKSGETFSSGM